MANLPPGKLRQEALLKAESDSRSMLIWFVLAGLVFNLGYTAYVQSSLPPDTVSDKMDELQNSVHNGMSSLPEVNKKATEAELRSIELQRQVQMLRAQVENMETKLSRVTVQIQEPPHNHENPVPVPRPEN